VREGGAKEWEFVWNRYADGTATAAERAALLRAMGCTRQIWLLNRFLSLAFTEGSAVRKQDVPAVVSVVAANPVGRDVAFDFVRGSWDRIKE